MTNKIEAKKYRVKCPFCGMLVWGKNFQNEPIFEVRAQLSKGGGRGKGHGIYYEPVPFDNIRDRLKQVWFFKIIQILEEIDLDFIWIMDFLKSSGYLKSHKKPSVNRAVYFPSEFYYPHIQRPEVVNAYVSEPICIKKRVVFEQEVSP